MGVLGLLLLTAACSSRATIGEIQDDPPAYEGQTVTLEGEVTSRLSFIFWKTYTLKDETGEITVVTKTAMPNVGAHVTVTGTVKAGFSLGSAQTLVLRDESMEED